MPSVLVFDASVASTNLGDQIITESVAKHLSGIFPGHHFLNTPTHERIGSQTYQLDKESDFTFVGGTNLLSSRVNKYNQWQIKPRDLLSISTVILMGVGWWQYQVSPSNYTGLFYRRLLHREILHSVRDTYTALKLREAGIPNVLNTGCPSTWDLTPEHLADVPKGQSPNVVFTLTDYNQEPAHDVCFVKLLLSKYDKVYFWPQGSGDEQYLRKLNLERITLLPPTLSAFDNLLGSDAPLDYVGTRLHACIRALQHHRRSICLGIDNRAREIRNDIGLQVVDRKQSDDLDHLITSTWETSLKIDYESISSWKRQFVF